MDFNHFGLNFTAEMNVDFTDQLWTWVWILEVKSENGYLKITVSISVVYIVSASIGYSIFLKRFLLFGRAKLG